MDRYGMQSIAFLIFLSFSVIYLLNSNRGDPLDLSTASSSSSRPSTMARSSSSSQRQRQEQQQVSSSGIEGQQRRRLLQSNSPYIGYGALTGDNVPCPPQSGRSYYTPNCQSATGPVNPYTRGCSTITKCARG
ncbi:unnamed protein product [Calypogeia fissa]